MTNATAYISSESITITSTSRVYDSTDFETNNLDYVKVELINGNIKTLLVKETDYTIAALDLGYKFRVRVTLVNVPTLYSEIKFSMNAPLSAPVDFVSPDVKRVDFDNMQRSVEQAAAQSATVEARVEADIDDQNKTIEEQIERIDEKLDDVQMQVDDYITHEKQPARGMRFAGYFTDKTELIAAIRAIYDADGTSLYRDKNHFAILDLGSTESIPRTNFSGNKRLYFTYPDTTADELKQLSNNDRFEVDGTIIPPFIDINGTITINYTNADPVIDVGDFTVRDQFNNPSQETAKLKNITYRSSEGDILGLTTPGDYKIYLHFEREAIIDDTTTGTTTTYSSQKITDDFITKTDSAAADTQTLNDAKGYTYARGTITTKIGDAKQQAIDAAEAYTNAHSGLTSDEDGKRLAAVSDLVIRREVKLLGQGYDNESVPTLSTGQSGAISLKQHNPPRVRFVYSSGESKENVDAAFLGRLITLTIDKSNSISLDVLSHERTLNLGSGWHAEEYAVSLHEHFSSSYSLAGKNVSVYLPPEVADTDGYTNDEIDTAIDTAKTEAIEYTDDKFESSPDWRQYFNYYFTGDGTIQTNVDNAGNPTPHDGATFTNGVFTFINNGDYFGLPTQISAPLSAAEVVIFGSVALVTNHDEIHPILFEAIGDGRPLLTRWNAGDYLSFYGNGARFRLSANGTFPANRELGVAAVFRNGSTTGWINGEEQLTANEDWGFESDDVMSLGENQATGIVNGNFIGTQKRVMIMSTNAAYSRLTNNEKNNVIASAAAWASKNDTTKKLTENVDLGELQKDIAALQARTVKETKNDVFISPAHFVQDAVERSRKYVAVKAGGTGTLVVGITQPTPPEAGSIEYAKMNVAIPIAEWDKCHKIGITSSHATSVMLNSDAFLYKNEITPTGTENQLASSDGRNNARVRFFANQTETETRSETTHRLEISGNVGRVYIGRVRLINLEVL